MTYTGQPWTEDYRTSPPDTPVVGALTCLTVFLAISISAFVLDYYGIPYSTPGGNLLFKIHPMTYMALIAFGAAMLSRGNPAIYIAECISRFPGTAYFMLLLILMITWTLVIQHQPLTSLIDTFLPASLLVFLIADLNPRQHRRLTLFIHVVMNANAIIGIIEVATNWRLTPISLAGEVVLWDWRASAILGHPLQNAMLSGVYMLMMALGADRSVPGWMRAGIVVLQMLGQVAFGGRVAMVLSFTIVAVKALFTLGNLLRGRSFDPRIGAAVLMVIPMAILVGILAYNAGVFDRLVERFTDDGGSAATRASIITIFNSFPLSDLLLGPNPDDLVERTTMEGSLAGIESFVFGFFLQSGILISLFFFCGLAAITYDLWRVASPASIIYIFFFYIVAAGAASLSVKGQTMTQFVILFMTVDAMPSLLDPDPPWQPDAEQTVYR